MAFFGLIKRKTSTTLDKPTLDSTIDGITGQRNPSLNPEFSTFSQIAKSIEEIVANRSVVNSGLKGGVTSPVNEILFSAMQAHPLQTDKVDRLNIWRNASAYPEVDFCLGEIADDFFHTDETGNFVNLIVNEEKEGMNEDRVEILQSEFKRYISYFDLENEGYNLVKRFLVEGELAWENIIDPEKPDRGIIGVKFLPADYYEYLLNKDTNTKVGIYFNLQKLKAELAQIVSSAYLNAYRVFNTMYGGTIGNYSDRSCIPMSWPQVTYISSGETTPDGLIVLSMMEKCKQAYYQLGLMQDAMVILRITRAPERLLYNISTAGLPDKKAEDYVRNFMMSLKSKKVAMGAAPTTMGGGGKSNEPNITSVYDPVSMVESYVFGKSNANDGTTIESIPSTANYEQIEDVDYFLRRLLKQFKVAYSRYKTPENTLEKNDAISYEEYSQSRQEIRLQKRFALGFKAGFITHLKLRDLWKKYNLTEADLKVEFVPPVLYDLYQTQKLVEAKVATYTQVADREELSKITAMKTFLGYTDADVEENYNNLLKEGLYTKKVEWAQNQADEKGFSDTDLVDAILAGKTENTENEDEENENEGEEGGGEESEGEEETGGEEEAPEETGNEEETGGEEGGEETAEEPDNVESGDFGLG